MFGKFVGKKMYHPFRKSIRKLILNFTFRLHPSQKHSEAVEDYFFGEKIYHAFKKCII